jgi:hypothetical protein
MKKVFDKTYQLSVIIYFLNFVCEKKTIVPLLKNKINQKIALVKTLLRHTAKTSAAQFCAAAHSLRNTAL